MIQALEKNKIYSGVLTTILILCFGTSIPLKAGQVESIPNPMEAAGLFVQDSAGVLGSEYSLMINVICRELKDRTSSELCVVTVESLDGLPIEEFALRLFERFGIGERGKDNGILILFARNDREIRMEVGYGLENVVTDADASRLLDEQAIPFFKEGLYARGLYNTVKKTASDIAASMGLTLASAAEGPLPEEPLISEQSPLQKEVAALPKKPNGWKATLVYTAAIFGFTLFGFVMIFLRMITRRTKASRIKSVRSQLFFLPTMWAGALFGFIILSEKTGFLLPLLFSGMAASVLSTKGLFKGINWLRRRAEAYRARCPECGRKMNLFSEEADDAFLSVEERAEEASGGMNYEIWKCPHCDATKRISVKLSKARKCPQCKRRTLKTSTTVLSSATRSSGGRIRILEKCKNPKCRYSKTHERDTPKLPPPGSYSSSSARSSFSSSSSGRSSRSSFGGGRSGGGGASKRW